MGANQNRRPAHPRASVKESLQRLLQQLIEGDEQAAEAAAAQIAHLSPAQQTQALAALRAMLETPDADRRWWAVRALSEIEHEAVPALLVQALGDNDPGVRQCAALALRQHPDPRAIPALASCLGDSDPLTARLAADALAAAGEAAAPYLIEALQNGPQAARLEAVRALAALGDKSSVPALFQALDDESALIEYWATQGLERMGIGMTFFNPG